MRKVRLFVAFSFSREMADEDVCENIASRVHIEIEETTTSPRKSAWVGDAPPYCYLIHVVSCACVIYRLIYGTCLMC